MAWVLSTYRLVWTRYLELKLAGGEIGVGIGVWVNGNLNFSKIPHTNF